MTMTYIILIAKLSRFTVFKILQIAYRLYACFAIRAKRDRDRVKILCALLTTMSNSQPELMDRFKGCFYGLAVGDALGGPLEFKHLYSLLYCS
jgi:hypothetical protein